MAPVTLRQPLSQRNEADRLLDAARASVLAVGVRRTTFSDVARRAGVSRMTLYRRHPDVASIIGMLMTREFGAIIARADAEAADRPTARERLIEGCVHSAELLVGDELFQRILEVEPE